MLPSFTVIDAARTRLFRTEFQNFKASLKVADEVTEAYYELNFDNFRRYTSPRTTKTAEGDFAWDYKMLFVYETIYWELLAAKTLSITYYVIEGKNPAFVGTASVDLLTLAAGPSDVTLTINNGDMNAGMATMIIGMEEIAQVLARCEELQVSLPKANLANCIVSITTKSQPAYTHESTGPRDIQHGLGIFREIPEHFFGTTVEQFLSNSGFTFEIKSAGVVSNSTIARGMLTFSGNMGIEADGTMSNVCNFRDLELNDPNSGEVVGSISGTVNFENLPLFVQMHTGRSVDGIVIDGREYPGARRVKPPRVQPSQQASAQAN